MRSRLPDVDADLAVERALRLAVCGIGGRLRPAPGSLTEALASTAREYDERSARRLERFADVPDGSVVWTRDPDGLFRRGVLAGAWRYDASPEAYAADLVHVRDCGWDPDPRAEHQVPAPVAATYRRGGRNFQRIRAIPAAEEPTAGG